LYVCAIVSICCIYMYRYVCVCVCARVRACVCIAGRPVKGTNNGGHGQRRKHAPRCARRRVPRIRQKIHQERGRGKSGIEEHQSAYTGRSCSSIVAAEQRSSRAAAAAEPQQQQQHQSHAWRTRTERWYRVPQPCICTRSKAHIGQRGVGGGGGRVLLRPDNP